MEGCFENSGAKIMYAKWQEILFKTNEVRQTVLNVHTYSGAE